MAIQIGNLYILNVTTDNLSMPDSLKIQAIGFYGSDTTSKLVLTTVSNTNNAIVAFGPTVTAGPWSDHKFFGGWYMTDTLRVLSLVNGTGWIYVA